MVADFQGFADEREDGLRSYLSVELIEAVSKIEDEVWAMTDKELAAMAQPAPIDYSLRTSFWREVEKAIDGGMKVLSKAVHAGICSGHYWRHHVAKDNFKLAWVCRPVQHYEREIDALLVRGTERLWEIVDIPLDDPRSGRFCPRRATVLLEAVKMIENRSKGLAVQRTQAVNLNLNAQSVIPDSPKELDNRIMELEKKIKPMLPPSVMSEIVIELPVEGACEVVINDEPDAD